PFRARPMDGRRCIAGLARPSQRLLVAESLEASAVRIPLRGEYPNIGTEARTILRVLGTTRPRRGKEIQTLAAARRRWCAESNQASPFFRPPGGLRQSGVSTAPRQSSPQEVRRQRLPHEENRAPRQAASPECPGNWRKHGRL